jgi:hypothetical protein
MLRRRTTHSWENGVLAFDVAGGFSTIVYRTRNLQALLFREKTADTMVLASKVAEFVLLRRWCNLKF